MINSGGGKILYFEIDPPEVREYYAVAKTAAKQHLTLWLKKDQTGWIFARKA